MLSFSFYIIAIDIILVNKNMDTHLL